MSHNTANREVLGLSRCPDWMLVLTDSCITAAFIDDDDWMLELWLAATLVHEVWSWRVTTRQRLEVSAVSLGDSVNSRLLIVSCEISCGVSMYDSEWGAVGDPVGLMSALDVSRLAGWHVLPLVGRVDDAAIGECRTSWPGLALDCKIDLDCTQRGVAICSSSSPPFSEDTNTTHVY